MSDEQEDSQQEPETLEEDVETSVQETVSQRYSLKPLIISALTGALAATLTMAYFSNREIVLEKYLDLIEFFSGTEEEPVSLEHEPTPTLDKLLAEVEIDKNDPQYQTAPEVEQLIEKADHYIKKLNDPGWRLGQYTRGFELIVRDAPNMDISTVYEKIEALSNTLKAVDLPLATKESRRLNRRYNRLRERVETFKYRKVITIPQKDNIPEHKLEIEVHPHLKKQKEYETKSSRMINFMRSLL